MAGQTLVTGNGGRNDIMEPMDGLCLGYSSLLSSSYIDSHIGCVKYEGQTWRRPRGHESGRVSLDPCQLQHTRTGSALYLGSTLELTLLGMQVNQS